MDEIILENKDGQVLASSREVAERFGKRHAEVIYAIEGRIDSNGKVKNNGLLMSGISQLSQMFIKSKYMDSQNRTQYEYLMNRDGFSLLVMGFTGKEALHWKLKYMEAFNKMEETIKLGNYLSEEEKLKLQLFSKDVLEVATAHNKLVKMEVEKAGVPLLKNITEQKKIIEQKDTDNKALAGKILDWADRDRINAGIRKLASAVGKNVGALWNELYKDLQYKYKIYLKSRKEHDENSKSKTPCLDYVRDDEWVKVLKVFCAMCEAYEKSPKDMMQLVTPKNKLSVSDMGNG